MISKILSIQNVGRFVQSASHPNPRFNKHNAVFAPNASGKTTLCAILRSLASNDPSEIQGRRRLGAEGASKVDLLLSSGIVTYSNGKWSDDTWPISVFDGAFVQRNVHSGDVVDISNRRELYRVIIGKEGVSFAEREAELTALAKDKQAEIRAAEEAIAAVAGAMPVKDFLKLQSLEDADKTIADKEALIASLKVSDSIANKAKLTEHAEIAVPDGILGILETDIDALGDAAEKTMAKHFARHGMEQRGQAWVGEGLSYVADDTCPLCGRGDFEGLPLIQAYRGLFSEKYQELRGRVVELSGPNLDETFGSSARTVISQRFETNSVLLSFWKTHCAFESTPESVSPIIEAVRAIGDRLQLHVDRKLGAVSEPAINDQDRKDIEALVLVANEAVDIANAEIKAINSVIEAKKASIGDTDLAAETAALATKKLRRERHGETGAKLCKRLAGLKAEKKAFETEKKAVRQSLEDHTTSVITPYENRINFFLRRFQAGFSIAKTDHSYTGGVATSSYQLKINDVEIGVGDAKTPVTEPSFKNTLSGGDKSTLALAFFLAHLEKEDRLEERIVVFDDPFNSQDAFRRNQTIVQIMQAAKYCGQLIVLSHDIGFVEDIWAKFPADERAAAQIDYHRSEGSKIRELDVKNACRGRTTQERDALLNFMASGTGDPVDLIKKMRVVCESYFRFAYPGFFDEGDNCGAILQKIRDGGDEHPAHAKYDDLDEINDYSSQYHHGENARKPDEQAIDRTELEGYVERALILVNANP